MDLIQGDKGTIQSSKETQVAGHETDTKDTDPQDTRIIVEGRDLLRRAKVALQQSVDARRRYDYEWMVRDMFRRGYQFSRYQPTSQTVILASRQSAKIPINIVNAQMRSIRNQVTSFRPKFEILPRHTTTDSETQARYAGQILDYLYDHLKMKNKIKETVMQGLMFSVGGPWEIYYDEKDKEIKIWLIDPFDFYFDPFAEELEDAEFCIKAVKRPLEEVIKNPDFDLKARHEITGTDARVAVSEYKQFMIQAMKQISQYTSDMNSTIILYDGKFKARDENGKVYIKRLVWTDQNITPLLYEELDTDKYNYVIYRADINPKEVYGEGWMKHVMPINRVINLLESSTFEYNHRMAKGRIVVDRDSGVRAIHNMHGEIISKNKGADVRSLDMSPLPVAVQNQIERMGRYIEDIGGAHDASLGRIPEGVKSGVGVSELRQADSTNQDDLVDNLEDFLTEVAMKILETISDNYTTYHTLRALGVREGEEKYFAIVGEKSGKKGNKELGGKVKIGPDVLDLAVIGADNNIRVTIGSWLGYTKENMQEKVLQLAKAGMIDQKTFLRLWEFGNVDEIVQQTRIEKLLSKNLQSGSPQNAEEDQYGLAMTENEMMVNENKDMPVDPHDDHLVHVAIHQEAFGQGADQLVGKHIQLHQMYLSQGPQQGSTQQQQSPQGQQPQQGGQQPPMGGGQPNPQADQNIQPNPQTPPLGQNMNPGIAQ